MPKINEYYLKNEIQKPVERSLDGFNKPFETVYELKKDEYQIPTFEEFMKSYQADEKVNYSDLSGGSVGEVKGYGPCKNSLCGCSCSSYTCNCASSSIRVEPTGTGFSASGRVRNGNASGQVSHHLFSVKESDGEVRFLSSGYSGSIGKSGVKGQASFDVANFKSDGVQGRVGVNLDSGVSFDNGVEIKAAGLGFSVDDDQVGISTPLGEVKVDKDKCAIQ